LHDLQTFYLIMFKILLIYVIQPFFLFSSIFRLLYYIGLVLFLYCAMELKCFLMLFFIFLLFLISVDNFFKCIRTQQYVLMLLFHTVN